MKLRSFFSLTSSLSLFYLASPALSGAQEERPRAPQDPTQARQYLPSFAENTAGILGPFYWGRAADLGEDARFSDAYGRPAMEGNYLWNFGYARLPGSRGVRHFIHARNNFIARESNTAYRIQPYHFLHNTTGSHNSKIMVGYVEDDFRFLHADNEDLAHLAETDRVILFLPVRHRHGATDRTNQENYFVNPAYAAQSACIIEFKAGEIIEYDWFGNPDKLDGRILYDLTPHLAVGENRIYPGVTKPIFQFDVGEDGAWTLKILRDGRGIDLNSKEPIEWDEIHTHESPGAQAYTVNLDPIATRWSMSVFSPGGSPTETSEILIGLQPYDRSNDETISWTDRSPRIRTAPVDRLQ